MFTRDVTFSSSSLVNRYFDIYDPPLRDYLQKVREGGGADRLLARLDANAALIGTNTYGKPVGQIALDRSQCDDRLRVIAFALQNANRQGAYYNGLVGTVEASCQADDDLTHAMGSPQEHSTRAALDYLAGRSCTAVTASGALQSGQSTRIAAPKQPMELLSPERPGTVQREVPGAF